MPAIKLGNVPPTYGIHFICAVLLSCTLFLTVDRINISCDIPTLNISAFIYFVEDLFVISN